MNNLMYYEREINRKMDEIEDVYHGNVTVRCPNKTIRLLNTDIEELEDEANYIRHLLKSGGGTYE